MALENWKSKILTSLHGRKIGLDHNNYILGHRGDRIPYEASTAASTLSDHGMSALSGSSADFTLPAPAAPGVEKIIVNLSSLATATMGIVRSSSLAFSFNGSSAASGPIGARLNLVGAGSAVTLRAISTAVWAPVGYFSASTVPAYAVTTSS